MNLQNYLCDIYIYICIIITYISELCGRVLKSELKKVNGQHPKMTLCAFFPVKKDRIVFFKGTVFGDEYLKSIEEKKQNVYSEM